MSDYSQSYLLLQSRKIIKNGKLVALFSLALLMILPFAIPAPAKSSPSQISPHLTPNISPNVSPDFSITANPATVTTTAGSTKTSQITITSIGGFAGSVYMEASSFSFPVSFPVSLNPPIVTLGPSGSATSTLTVSIPSNALPGSNTIFIQATDGCTLFHFQDVSVTVTGPDFTITSDKSHITLAPSGSDTANIHLASTNGFTGLISLSSFSQFTTNLNPPSITLTPGGTGASVLTIAAPMTVQPGNYTLSVNGLYSAGGGFITHSADIIITVTGPALVLTVSRYFLTLVAGGSSNNTIITATGSGGLTGQVSLAATPATPLSPTLNPTSVALGGTSVLTVSAPLGTKDQTYFIDVTGTAGTGGTVHDSTAIIVKVKAPDFEISADPFFMAVVAGGSSCTSTITITSILGFSGVVNLVKKAPSALTTTLSPTSVTGSGTATLTVGAPTGTVPGFYTVDVNGTSTSPALTHSASVDILVIGPDFSLSASPDPVTAMAGSSGTSTVNLAPILGFTGTVQLVASSFDAQLTVSVSPQSITPGTPATLTVNAALGTVPGSFYSVQVNGTSGQISHSIYVSVTVIGPGFYLTASPPALTVNAGPTPQTSTITVIPTNGFNSPVDLFASPDSVNLSASITPTTVISPSYTATLTVNSTIPGSYKVDIFGSSGFLSNQTSVTVTVVGPDFKISAAPTSLTITAGGSKASTITVNPVGGFNTSVALTATSSTGITPTFNPTSITPPTTSTLTIAVDPGATPGPYTIDIHGTSGSITRATQLTVNVVGFTLAVSPSTLTIVEGASQASQIAVAPVNGFTDTVQLSAALPTGLTGTPTPASITGGSGTSTLSITAASSIAPGTYLVNVTGTSGSLTQKVAITVTVPAPDFDISPSTPTSVQCTVGNSCTATITIAPRNGFTGKVAFTASPEIGLLCTSIAPVTIPTNTTTNLSCHSITAGTFTVAVTGASGALSHSTAVITCNVAVAQDFSISAGRITPALPIAGASATSAISVLSMGGFTGAVSFQVSAATPSGLTCTAPAIVYGQGESDLTCSTTVAGNYTVSVTGTATISGSQVTHTTGNFVIPFFDFTISAGAVAPSSVLAGSTASSTITVHYLNVWTATVLFTVSASSPSGLSCNTPSLVSGGGTQTSTLSCSASTTGDYTVTVTGIHSSLSHSTANIVFHVMGFTVAATSPAAAKTGQTATSTITVSPVNGFTGTVQLSDTPLPTGLICSPISQTSVILTSTTATATLDCHSTQDGTFTVTITGASGSLAPQATATFIFHTPDITVTSTTPASINSGQSSTSTINVSPTYGFTGTVTLAVSAPSGITCTLDHSTLQGSGTTTLTCTSSAPNDYTVTVTATGGAATHTTTQTFHVAAAPSPAAPAPTIFGLSPLVFYGLIGVLIVAVIGGVAVVIRRKNS